MNITKSTMLKVEKLQHQWPRVCAAATQPITSIW